MSFFKRTLHSLCLFGVAAIATQSLGSPALAQFSNRSRLTVKATGVRNGQGQICFSLYNRSEGFPNDPDAIIEKQCVAAMAPIDAEALPEGSQSVESAPVVTFENLDRGTYAVSVLHDENEDSEINTGAFGIPSEGFGFSRNPTVQMGAPKFHEAAVVVVGPNATMQINLIYF